MDVTPILIEGFKGLWWLIPLALVVAFFQTPLFKGWLGELTIRLSAKLLLPGKQYYPIHNVALRTPDGTTQIDHIFVSIYGVFVVETKNLRGWIFGSEKQAQWTQKIFKNTYRFQNPLRQNFKHVKALESALSIPAEAIHSVVVFVGGSTFKTDMPRNVTYGGGYATYIRSFKKRSLTQAQVRSVIAQIESGRLQPSLATNREHVQNIKSRSDLTAEKRCPKCGSLMVLRTAKKGRKAGNKFWGCSAFPKCRQVLNIT